MRLPPKPPLPRPKRRHSAPDLDSRRWAKAAARCRRDYRQRERPAAWDAALTSSPLLSAAGAAGPPVVRLRQPDLVRGSVVGGRDWDSRSRGGGTVEPMLWV